MIKAFWIVIATFISVPSYSQSGTGTIEFSDKRMGHTASVIFTIKKFDLLLHRISGLDPCDDFRKVRIDGRFPMGPGICDMPDREIQSMRLIFDGRKIDIPNKLYSDCYNTIFLFGGNDTSRFFALRIGDDLSSVFVFMGGGDGSGSYQVLWNFRTDGKHTRFSGSCSDCQFIDFDSGFFSLD